MWFKVLEWIFFRSDIIKTASIKAQNSFGSKLVWLSQLNKPQSRFFVCKHSTLDTSNGEWLQKIAKEIESPLRALDSSDFNPFTNGLTKLHIQHNVVNNNFALCKITIKFQQQNGIFSHQITKSFRMRFQSLLIHQYSHICFQL